MQDNLGFMWFPTQYWLNRYDSYKFKVFKHEPEHADSLSCVYIHSLIKESFWRRMWTLLTQPSVPP